MALLGIGKIVAAHGVKGLVKILPYGGDFSWQSGDVLTKEGKPVAITLKNPAGKYILASVKDVTDRTAAESLAGTELFTTREKLPPLKDKNKFYIADLIGLEAVEDGKTIGKIIAVDNFGAGDLLEIRSASGESFYLPFNDDYVGEISDTVKIKNYKDFIE